MPSISIFALAHFSPQSLFQTLATAFFQRTVQQSRTSFSFRNQYFTVIHLFERHNGNKFFVVGSCYRKEMALDGPGFIQATVARRRAPIYFCFISTSSKVTVVSPLKWNTLRFFNRHDLVVAYVRTSIYNSVFHLGRAIVAATKIARAWSA